MFYIFGQMVMSLSGCFPLLQLPFAALDLLVNNLRGPLGDGLKNVLVL